MSLNSSSKPRVVFLADIPLGRLCGFRDFPIPAGHYSTWLEALIPEFEKVSDFDFHWIAMSKSVSKPLTRCTLGQTFHILPRRRKLFSMVTAYSLETRRIKRFLDSLEPDLLHAWGSEDVYGLAGSRSGFQPRIFTLQGCVSETVAKDSSPHPLLRLQALFESGSIRRYQIGTGESSVAVNHLRRINPGMIASVIDYGVAREFYGAQWNPVETPRVLFAGSLSRPKGVPELIEVFKNPQFKNVSLELAGDGPLAEYIAKSELPNIRLLGRLTRQQLISAMEKAWCLAVPTHADTGPSVLKEARVVGMPVVTTSAAGSSDLVQDSGCGYVVPPGNSAELGKAMLSILINREHCRTVGSQGWDAHREMLHPARTAHSFGKLYQQFLLKP